MVAVQLDRSHSACLTAVQRTNLRVTSWKGRVLISRGRDAADVAMATTFGAPWLKRMTVFADEVVSA